MASAENLTDWEKTHLQHVCVLWMQAEKTMNSLRDRVKAREAEDANCDLMQDWLDFRYIVFDLYSVLDYTYYLLHCHFTHAARSKLLPEEAPCNCQSQFGFPYKAKGVKTSISENQDKMKKFEDEQTSRLCQNNSVRAKRCIEYILSLQPKLKVNAAGGAEGGGPQVFGSDAELLAMLHHYRNCVTHRGLICFTCEGYRFEYDLNTRSKRFCAASEKREGPRIMYMDVPSKFYWIKMPGIIKEEKRRPLEMVLEALFAFVRSTFNTLLEFAGIQYMLPNGTCTAAYLYTLLYLLVFELYALCSTYCRNLCVLLYHCKGLYNLKA